MATTVHIPRTLLEKVDARAKTLGVSRNRLIVDTLESSLVPNATWPPELTQLLEQPLAPETAQLLDESLATVAARRQSRRRPIDL